MTFKRTLSEAQLDKIFTTQIVPVLFGDIAPTDDPLLILIGAQPGAGKSLIGEAAIQQATQPVVDIIGDDLRAYHPDYLTLLQQYPSLMPEVTQEASGAWVRRAIDYAATERISVLVEGTFRSAKTTLGTATKFKEAGFQVQAILVAVPPNISRTSTANRFVEASRKSRPARFTPLGAHEVAFSALPGTLNALAASGAPVDRILVTSRSAVLFDGSRHGVNAIKGASAAAAAEWQRVLTREESDAWIGQTAEAVIYLRAHPADDIEVEKLTERLIRDLDDAGWLFTPTRPRFGHGPGGFIMPKFQLRH